MFFLGTLVQQKSVKSGQPASKRRKYRFYDQFLFLLPTVQVRETSGNAELVVSGEEYEGTEDYQSPPVIPFPHTNPNSNKNNKKSYAESLLDILREKKEERMDDRETHFALSLVPMLKAIPTHQKIDVQIQILQILKNVQNQYPPRDTPDFSSGVGYPNNYSTTPSNVSTPLRLLTGTSATINQTTTGNRTYTPLTSPQNSDSVQSYVSNFSVASDGSETMYGVNAHSSNSTKLN